MEEEQTMLMPTTLFIVIFIVTIASVMNSLLRIMSLNQLSTLAVRSVTNNFDRALPYIFNLIIQLLAR